MASTSDLDWLKRKEGKTDNEGISKMTNKKIDKFRQKLKEILLIEVPASQRQQYLKSLEDKFHRLMSLGQKVGASCYLRTESVRNVVELLDKSSDLDTRISAIEAMICEFVYNINDALRTGAAINATKAASRSCLISIISVIVAIAAAVAAWFIALRAD